MLYATFFLALSVTIYNIGGSFSFLLGILMMAACRVQNLLLGVWASNCLHETSIMLTAACALLFYYIALVTYLARYETEKSPSKSGVFLIRSYPFLVIIVFKFILMSALPLSFWIIASILFFQFWQWFF